MATATIAATVTGLRGHPVAATLPTTNQVLTWNGTNNNWAPAGPYLPLSGGTLTGNITTSGNIQVTGGGYFQGSGNSGSFLNGNGYNIATQKGAGAWQYLTSAAWVVTSTSNIMAGFGSTATPFVTGRMFYFAQMICGVSSSSGNPNFDIQGMYGTGTPPVQNAPQAGSGFGINSGISTGLGNTYGWAGTVSGLTIGTQYWFDILGWVGPAGIGAQGQMSYVTVYVYEL